MLELYSAIFLIICLSLLVMLYNLAISIQLTGKSRNWFISAFFATIVVVLCDWTWYIFSDMSNGRIMQLVFKSILCTTAPVIPVLISRAINWNKGLKLVIGVLGFNAILQIINICRGVAYYLEHTGPYYIDNTSPYLNEGLSIIYPMVCAASILYLIVGSYQNSKLFKHQRVIVLISIVALLSVGLGISGIYENSIISSASICFALYLLYIYYSELNAQGMDLNAKRQTSMARALALDYDQLSLINISTGKIYSYIFNRRAPEKQMDLSYEEAFEKYANTKVYEEDRELFRKQFYRDRVLKELELNKTYGGEFRINSEYGPQYYTIKCVKDVIDGEDYVVCGFRNTDATMRDMLQHQENLEIARKKAESANAAKSEFIERISLDIRTPITATISMTELAIKNITNVSVARDYLERAISSSERLMLLVNDMMDMGAIERKNFEIKHESMNIAATVGNCAHLFSQQLLDTEKRLVVELGKFDNPFVLGDSERLTLALMHLLNRIAALGAEGNIISFRSNEESEGDSTVLYRFEIATTSNDSGSLAAFEEWKKILITTEIGENALNQGSNIDIAISKNHITLMGGSVSIKSLGERTGFVVEIPFAIDEKTLKKNAEEQENSNDSLTGIKIMVVEDNKISREITTSILEKEGALVTSMENGRIAVETFSKSPLNYYDAVLMDVYMPELDGLEASRIIRAMNRADSESIPIIAMTGYSGEEAERQTIEAGMNAYLEKPIVLADLVNTLHECIRLRSLYLAERLESALLMATRDSLTGVRNRTAYDRLVHQINNEIETGGISEFAVVVCDINGLKNINDTAGHEFGNKLIINSCKLICNAFKKSPVFRIGGDEFAAILRGEDYENREHLMTELCNRVKMRDAQASLACGISDFRVDEDTRLENVFERADARMYALKREMKSQGLTSKIPIL